MSLGNNRDYKTTDRRARKALAKHSELMEKWLDIGANKETASKLAMAEMEKKSCPICQGSGTLLDEENIKQDCWCSRLLI